MAQSETIGKLATALTTAQLQFKNLEKSAENPFYKSRYAPLDAVIEATRGALAAHGLVVIQATEGLALRTVLMHLSGEWIDGLYPLCPVKNDPQGLGAAITYARRYSLQAILGICAESDDEGELTRSATPHAPSRPVAPPSRQEREPELDEDEMSPPQLSGKTRDTVRSVEVRASGTSKSGKPYTLYEIEFSDSKATTFDAKLAEAAKSAMIGDKWVQVVIEKGQKFRQYGTYDLKSLETL